MEQLDWLIKFLAEERGEVGEIPDDEERKFRLWRALVNVRPPKEISTEYIEKENQFLQDRLKKFKIIDGNYVDVISTMYPDTKLRNQDKIALIQCDITRLRVDAIVNPANEGGTGCYLPNHNCLDNQITTFGGVMVRIEGYVRVKEMGGVLDTGNVMITKGYNLPAKFIIHTTGPIVEYQLTDREKLQLEKCYLHSLLLAKEKKLRIIAFPSISTGVFRFPKKEAAIIALKTIDHFLDKNKDSFDKVIITVYSDEDLKIYEKVLGECL